MAISPKGIIVIVLVASECAVHVLDIDIEWASDLIGGGCPWTPNCDENWAIPISPIGIKRVQRAIVGERARRLIDHRTQGRSRPGRSSEAPTTRFAKNAGFGLPR